MLDVYPPIKKKIVWAVLLACLLSILVSFSGGVVCASTAYPLDSFEYLEDTQGAYDFDAIISTPLAGKFQQSPHTVISLGITHSAYWVRFHLPPIDSTAYEFSRLLQVGNPNLDKIDLFLPVIDKEAPAGVRYLQKSVGVSRTASAMEIKDNTWVFLLPQQIRTDQFLYLRLESGSALRVPLLLWQTDAFLSESFLKNLGFGTFFGILLSLFFYNLFVFFVLRDKAYLFYVLYIGCMFLYQFQVHGYLKLWVSASYPIYNAIFWVCLSAAFIFAVYFTGHFLHVHNENKFWDKIKKFLIATAVLQGILGSVGHTVWANHIGHGLGLGGPLIIMGFAAFRLYQGFKPALYYLLAWGILSCGIVIWVLAAYIPETFSAATILLVATASEAILLSFALSDRFRSLRLKESVMKEHIQYYRDLSIIDSLTGLYNKRHFLNKMNQEVEFAQQNNTPLSLLMIDIDQFKAYNDQYGHWEGDQVLIRFGKVLPALLASGKLAFRYGGEELAVLAPRIAANDAVAAAEQIRQRLQNEDFSPESALQVHVSVSIGVAELTPADTSESFFQRADNALYQAKNSGRNRVCVF
jgi:diguanylate cyclase (GGDEF)-like protein